MAISETKGQGWRAIPTQWRKARDILTSTQAALWFSRHPKRERDREAQIITLALTTVEDQQWKTTITLQDKTKSNMTKQACILN